MTQERLLQLVLRFSSLGEILDDTKSTKMETTLRKVMHITKSTVLDVISSSVL